MTMPTAIEFIADRLPRVTVADVRRFADTVEIRDARAFAAELEAFVHERVEAVKLPASLEVETVPQAMARKAAALRADTRWAPTETDIQRGRAALLETFSQPHNLPIPEFAKLADKSRQQIYKDILARRLLASGCGDAWHDRRRGRGRVQRAGRSGALKRDRHEPRAAFVPDRCRRTAPACEPCRLSRQSAVLWPQQHQSLR